MNEQPETNTGNKPSRLREFYEAARTLVRWPSLRRTPPRTSGDQIIDFAVEPGVERRTGKFYLDQMSRRKLIPGAKLFRNNGGRDSQDVPYVEINYETGELDNYEVHLYADARSCSIRIVEQSGDRVTTEVHSFSGSLVVGDRVIDIAGDSSQPRPQRLYVFSGGQGDHDQAQAMFDQAFNQTLNRLTAPE